ncbi:MAG: SigB/SigF/SigG family RNA polymerase sigma factor [Acidimicrobiia bacterium]
MTDARRSDPTTTGGASDAALFKRYAANRDRRLRNELIERHRWVAAIAARRFRHRGENQDDLEQVALLGVLKAVERFDPDRGAAFSSFAMPTVLGELRRHFRDTTWAVHVTRGAKELYLELNRASEALSHELQRPPRVEELAELVDVSVEAALEALDAGQGYRTAPLDQPAGAGAEPSGTEHPSLLSEDARMLDAPERVTLQRNIARLPPRSQKIVLLRFFGDLTQSEIAEQLDLSQVHVSRLLRAALRELREAYDHTGSARSAG